MCVILTEAGSPSGPVWGRGACLADMMSVPDPECPHVEEACVQTWYPVELDVCDIESSKGESGEGRKR